MKAAFILAVLALHPGAAAAADLTIAAAANLTEVFRKTIGPQFEKATGIHPVFSFGATANLTLQIENGAPFDVFAAADTEHVDQLEKKGLLTPRSRAVYATGILALWIPPGRPDSRSDSKHAGIEKIEDLVQPDVKTIAVAKPELAPYGAATVETLKNLGLWTRVEPKIVYSDSISMARQYGTSGNADAVFTAYSLVMKDGGKVIQIPEKTHQPIAQALAIVVASKHQPEARQFTEFLLRGKGRDTLAASGYRVDGQ